jgi:hypothetical protein
VRPTLWRNVPPEGPDLAGADRTRKKKSKILGDWPFGVPVSALLYDSAEWLCWFRTATISLAGKITIKTARNWPRCIGP